MPSSAEPKSRLFPSQSPEAAEPEAEEAQVPQYRDANGRYLRPGFTPSLVGRARQLGLSDDDLADMSPDDLREEIRERGWNERLDKVLNVRETMDRVAREAKESIKNTPQPPFDPGLSEENAAPEIVAAMKRVAEHYEGRIDKLEKQLGEHGAKMQAREQQEAVSYSRRIEKEFAKYPHIFGTGQTDKLPQDGVELGFRLTANTFHRQQGGEPGDLADNIAEFAKKFQTGKPRRREEPEEEVDEAAEWEAGVLERPTQAGPREAPPSVEKARQNVRQKLDQAGLNSTRTRGKYLRHGPSQPNTNGQG